VLRWLLLKSFWKCQFYYETISLKLEYQMLKVSWWLGKSVLNSYLVEVMWSIDQLLIIRLCWDFIGNECWGRIQKILKLKEEIGFCWRGIMKYKCPFGCT
jgi:hypothetical protein